MPDPRKGEKEDDYISRCVGNKDMNDEFPDQKQRLAVCYSKWERKDEGYALTFKEFLTEQENQ